MEGPNRDDIKTRAEEIKGGKNHYLARLGRKRPREGIDRAAKAAATAPTQGNAMGGQWRQKLGRQIDDIAGMQVYLRSRELNAKVQAITLPWRRGAPDDGQRRQHRYQWIIPDNHHGMGRNGATKEASLLGYGLRGVIEERRPLACEVVDNPIDSAIEEGQEDIAFVRERHGVDNNTKPSHSQVIFPDLRPTFLLYC